MEEKQQGFENGSGRRGSSWKVEDLLDLERCGLAADLASTNLGRAQVSSPGNWGLTAEEPGNLDFKTYDMSEVLDNLLDDMPLLPSPVTPMSKLSDCVNRDSVVSMTDLSGGGRDQMEAMLKAPTAHFVRLDQENVTYLNRGQSYEIQLMTSSPPSILYKCTLSVSFCEIRWQNSAKEHFEQWCRDHPCDRLIEIDSKGSTGIQCLEMDESTAVNRVCFNWGCGQKNAILSMKLNCLSTEFALKKHGGEKGVPLKLLLEVHECKDEVLGGQILVYRGGCSVKVFKDKGGDRKQRQDQLKAEKMGTLDRTKYQLAEPVTSFMPLPFDSNTECHTPSSSSTISFQATPDISSLQSSSSVTPAGSPFSQSKTVHNSVCPDNVPLAPSTVGVAGPPSEVGVPGCRTVEETQLWLVENRFGQFCSLFTNYTSMDLFRLSRRDLMQLCGQADGIRLFNSLRASSLKTVYILLPGEKVYQAVYLEKLSVSCFLRQLVQKLGWLSPDLVGSFVQFLPDLNLLVKVEDSFVQTMQDQDVFTIHTIKQEDGYYQLCIQNHYPSITNPLSASSHLTLNLDASPQRRD